MNRKEFLTTSAIIGGSTILSGNSVLAASLQQTGMDRLTDAEGNFALQPLPYTETFLEPSWTRRRCIYSNAISRRATVWWPLTTVCES
jgi:hypothetical protein